MKSTLLPKFLPALVVVLFGLPGLTRAQTTPPPPIGAPSPLTPQSPAGVPVDGGASLLLAGGIAYGLKKLRDRRRAGV